jgi:hypothetical protein
VVRKLGIVSPHLSEEAGSRLVTLWGLCRAFRHAYRQPYRFTIEGGAIQIVQRSDRQLGRSLRVLELSRSIGTRHIDLPLAWALPHEDVVIAFEPYSSTNWQASLVSTEGDVLLAFPWHDHADRILLGSENREFPIQADEEVWDALEEGWWAWVKADGPHVYLAECDGDEIDHIRRARKLEHRSPGLVAVDNVEVSWNRVPRVAYDRAWQDAIDTCRAGQPSPVCEWISEAPDDRRVCLRF